MGAAPVTAAPALRGPVTDALVALLSATCDVWVGDGSGDPDLDPDATVHSAAAPYLVVEEVPGGESYGSVGNIDGMTDAMWQVTAVARTRRGATNLADRARTAILERGADGFTHPLVATPTEVTDRRLDIDGGVLQEDGVFNAPQRYRLTCCAT